MIKDLIARSRSYRRFYQDVPIEESVLLELVDLARISPSASNRQPLRYYVSAGEKNEEIFACLKWAGDLPNWGGPAEGERPSAYIVILNDNRVSTRAAIDLGIATQNILLGAAEKGLGCCVVGSVNREVLAGHLALPEHLEIGLVIVLGKPRETVVLEPVGEDGSIKYWRDDEDVHHVPKRSLEEILFR